MPEMKSPFRILQDLQQSAKFSGSSPPADACGTIRSTSKGPPVMISGARQYSQRDFALSLTKARIALVTNASRQAGLPHSLSRIDVCGSPPCLRLYRPYVAGTQPALAHCAN